MPKTWRLGRYHRKASGMPVKAAAEGCEVLKPSKAAAEVFRVLRALESCCGSFEGFKACLKRAT